MDFKLNNDSYNIINNNSETHYKQYNIYNCDQTYVNESITLKNNNNSNNCGVKIGAYTNTP